jgi:hypothetical protein
MYPYLDNFIISETARRPDRVELFCSRDRIKSSELIREQLAAEVDAGTLHPISPEHFMINLSALCNYPLLAKAVLRTIHGMTEAAYCEFLLERKRVIYKTIFNEEMPTSFANELLQKTTT